MSYRNEKDQYSTSYFFDLSYTNTKKGRIKNDREPSPGVFFKEDMRGEFNRQEKFNYAFLFRR